MRENLFRKVLHMVFRLLQCVVSKKQSGEMGDAGLNIVINPLQDLIRGADHAASGIIFYIPALISGFGQRNPVLIVLRVAIGAVSFFAGIAHHNANLGGDIDGVKVPAVNIAELLDFRDAIPNLVSSQTGWQPAPAKLDSKLFSEFPPK